MTWGTRADLSKGLQTSSVSEIFSVSHFGKDFIRAGSDHFLPLSVWKTVKCSLAIFSVKGGEGSP